MSHIRRRNGRWQARYRGPDRRERTATFDRKIDAQNWLTDQDSAIAKGAWVDPALGRRTFGHYVSLWRRQSVGLKPKTRSGYESILSEHLLPRFELQAVGTFRKPAVRALIAELTEAGAAPGTVRNIVWLLSAVLETAVEDGALGVNPCRKVSLPKSEQAEMLFLSADDVEELASAIGGGLGPWVRFMAYSGLRFGEGAALRVRRLDAMRSRVRVTESVADVRGELITGPTKTYSERTVTVPRSITNEVVEMLGDRMNDPGALVFTSERGHQLRAGNLRRVFNRAIDEVGLEVDGRRPRIHDLRHTAVALAVQAGAHPQAIKERLGHASITTTLDRYGHLFPVLDETLAEGLDALRSGAVRDVSRTARGTGVVSLPKAMAP